MLKEKLARFRDIPSYVFLGLFLISLIISIAALRHNNQTMIRLRDEVYAADKGNSDVNTALTTLRKYVYSHMNTDLSSGGNSIKPPVQLKYTYERLQAQQDFAIRHGQTPAPIPAALYQFDFASPSWSPDLAGWSLLFSALFLVIFLFSFAIDRLVKAKLLRI